MNEWSGPTDPFEDADAMDDEFGDRFLDGEDRLRKMEQGWKGDEIEEPYFCDRCMAYHGEGFCQD